SGEREPHDNCINCHAYEIDEDCRKCHGVEEKARFRHAQTGFELGRYHAALKCRSCHQQGQPAARLNKDCNSCHQDWNRKTFNHQITGLMLDENHLDNDCIDCHINRDFSVAPRCDDCHDELSYPESLPGKVVR
ncbi:MAG: cytochrome c3 family protein, partial [Calditrichaeota bacterium]|nr:cytochrome c3 family protein [Calditrichota bacterium]